MTTLKQILRLIQKATARYELIVWFEDKKCVHRSFSRMSLFSWIEQYPADSFYHIEDRYSF